MSFNTIHENKTLEKISELQFVCACVRACVHACVRACVCVNTLKSDRLSSKGCTMASYFGSSTPVCIHL